MDETSQQSAKFSVAKAEVRFAQHEWTFEDLVAEHQRQLDLACETILGALAEGRELSGAKTDSSKPRLPAAKGPCAPDVMLPRKYMATQNYRYSFMRNESGQSVPPRLSLASRHSSLGSQKVAVKERFTVTPRAHKASMVMFDKQPAMPNRSSAGSSDSIATSSWNGKSSWNAKQKIRLFASSKVEKRATQLKSHVKQIFETRSSTHALSEMEMSRDFLTLDSAATTPKSITGSDGSDSTVSMSMRLRNHSVGGILDVAKRITGSPSQTKRRALSGFPAMPEDLLAHVTRAHNIFERLVSSPLFDAFCALLIIASMVMLGYETHVASQNSGQKPHHFFVATFAFNVWFTCELLIRIAAERKKFFWSSPDLPLNLMDTILVLTSVVDLIFGLITGGETSMDNSIGGSRVARAIRILRALRAMRLARVMQHVMQFRKMVYLIQGSFATLFWCLLLLFLLIYTFALLFTQGVTDHLLINDSIESEQSSSDQKHDLLLKAHYGSVPRSICSLFQSMSSGINWGIVFEPMLKLGWLYSASFIVFIAFSMFGVLNVLTSTFVESTVQIALTHRDLIQHEQEKQMEIAIKHLREVFMSIDHKGEGRMRKREMTFFLQDPYVHAYLSALDINLNDSETLFRLLDSDGSGEIGIDEFCRGCLKLKGHAKAFDLHCLISEVARYLEKWSQFTDFTVTKFHKFETLLETALQLQEWQHGELVKGNSKRQLFGLDQLQKAVPSDDLYPETNSFRFPMSL